MSAQKPPRLFVGGLTGRIYVATSYTEDHNGNVIANKKFDVTEDFKRIEAEREQQRYAENEDDS